jgi:hypothetical protein
MKWAYTVLELTHTQFYTYICKAYTKEWCASKSYYKFISHPKRAQHTLSSVGTVQVSNVLPAVHFSSLLRGKTSFQDGIAQEKVFCVLRFEVSRSVITVQCEFRALFKEHA